MVKGKETLGVDIAIPTLGEAKNGWTPATLTDFLRKSCPSKFEFRQEMLRRAQDRLAAARYAVSCDEEGDEALRIELEDAEAAVAACVQKMPDAV